MVSVYHRISPGRHWPVLGYHINDSGSVLLGYRGIGTNYEDGAFGYDAISHGILLGFECKF